MFVRSLFVFVLLKHGTLLLLKKLDSIPFFLAQSLQIKKNFPDSNPNQKSKKAKKQSKKS